MVEEYFLVVPKNGAYDWDYAEEIIYSYARWYCVHITETVEARITDQGEEQAFEIIGLPEDVAIFISAVREILNKNYKGGNLRDD